ncbi:TPA: hypothetical protein ACXRZ0_001744 [Klebsiella pneumoniae]
MINNHFSREELLSIIETDHLQYGEASVLARIALAAMDSDPVAYMHDGEDGTEYNGHNEFSGGGKGIPLYHHAQPAPASEPVFFIEVEGDDWINAGRIPGSAFDFNNLPDGINYLYAAPQPLTDAEREELQELRKAASRYTDAIDPDMSNAACLREINEVLDLDDITMFSQVATAINDLKSELTERREREKGSAAQPAPVVPENCVTAEHRRVIEMLLNVCGAAFELADDSCQQDVDGEDCHVVPDDAFQKLSDALDEIENTLPTEDIDRPDVFLAWSAMPRAALKSLLQAQPAPVVPDDVLDALQKVARIRLDMNDFDGDRRGIAECLGDAEEALIEVVNRRAAMLQELQKSAGAEVICRSNENVQALNTIKATPALGSLPKTDEVQNTNSPVIPDGYVMVPVELNGDMLAAAQDAYGETDGDIASTLRAAMLAAAPQEVM